MKSIEPDHGLLLAWQRATTGANAHDMSRTSWYYKFLCTEGEAKKAEQTAADMRVRLRVLYKQNGYDQFQR